MTTATIPEMFLLASSNLDAAGYHVGPRELHIRFKDGGHYVYADVPEEIFRELRAVSSPGNFFHRAIKRQFTHHKVV